MITDRPHGVGPTGAQDQRTGSGGYTDAAVGLGARRSPAGLRPLRVAVALSNPDHERSLLPALHDAGDADVVARCLDAAELATRLAAGGVDAVLLSADLHRLDGETLRAVRQAGVPVVALAHPEGAAGADRCAWAAAVLPSDAGGDAVCQALRAVTGRVPVVQPLDSGEDTATRADAATLLAPAAAPEDHPDAEDTTGGAAATAPDPRYFYNPYNPGADDAPPPSAADAEAPAVPTTVAAAVAVIALAGGAGSPGRTTVAVNLAVALGAVAPTVLVDLDLSGPAVAAYLDLDPTRNVYMLAHADPQTAGEWDRALRQELRPLGPRSPHGVVLGGVPKPEMRAGVPPRFAERLLAELRQRYRYIVVDTGAELLAPELAVHRAALAQADQVLMVASADLPGLAQARAALPLVRAAAGGTGSAGGAGGMGARRVDRPDRVALLLNRHDRRFHHGRREIEWALGLGTAAVIPHDHVAAQRALATQRPMVLDGRGAAARELLDLACRLHDGWVVLPPEPDAPRTAAGRLRAALRRRAAGFGVLRSRPTHPTQSEPSRAVPSPAGATPAVAAAGGSDE